MHKTNALLYRCNFFLSVLLPTLGLLLAHCNPPKRSTAGTPGRRPATTQPAPAQPGRHTPMDTIRWAPAPLPKPPIGEAPGAEPYTGQFYRLAILLPFLTDQADNNTRTVPEKSNLALQFYGGANLALQKLATEEGINLSVDVLDTRIDDTDFQRLFSNPRLNKAQVIIGPVRPSHVGLLAARIKQTRQILISPESPNMDLTAQNPDFIQTNPSLRAHCAAITRHVLQRHNPASVVLVSKQREADRLPFFQQANRPGNKPFAELLVPDDITSFDKIDLQPYLRGRKAVFILPTWTSQTYVMAFLQKLRSSKGSVEVEVYGMPQWKSFTNIEPEYFSELNVHISSAYYVDRDSPEARAFRQAFYDAYGTIPNDDAYNGYDVTLFTGRMLKRYGLSFPQRLAATEPFTGMHASFQFAKVFNTTPPDPAAGNLSDQLDRYDYLENIFVHILRYENYQFVPVN